MDLSSIKTANGLPMISAEQQPLQPMRNSYVGKFQDTRSVEGMKRSASKHIPGRGSANQTLDMYTKTRSERTHNTDMFGVSGTSKVVYAKPPSRCSSGRRAAANRGPKPPGMSAARTVLAPSTQNMSMGFSGMGLVGSGMSIDQSKPKFLQKGSKNLPPINPSNSSTHKNLPLSRSLQGNGTSVSTNATSIASQ